MIQTFQKTPPPLNILRDRIAGRRGDLSRLGATRVAIFGSCARQEQGPDSDVDLLVDLDRGRGYFDVGEMQALLESELHVEVNTLAGSAVPMNSAIRRECLSVF